MTRTTISTLIPRARTVAIAVVAGVFAACGSSPTSPGGSGGGGGGGGGGATNRAPVISASVNGGFGIQQLTTFTFNASVSDPDGDAVSVSWNFGDGTAASGTTVTHVYTSGGTFNVVATASDSKGASTPSGNITVVAGSMTGNWSVFLSTCGTFNMSLTQSGGVVTGTFVMPTAFCAATAGSTGRTDPAEPGSIDGNGNIQIRLKVGIFLDFYIRGRMDSSGRVVTGGAYNSGFNGNPVTMTKQ